MKLSASKSLKFVLLGTVLSLSLVTGNASADHSDHNIAPFVAAAAFGWIIHQSNRGRYRYRTRHHSHHSSAHYSHYSGRHSYQKRRARSHSHGDFKRSKSYRH